MSDCRNVQYHDSFDTLCMNLTGKPAGEILIRKIRKKDWMYFARRFMAAYSLLDGFAPEYAANPTEGLDTYDLTFENFKKTYGDDASKNYTLKQLFEYIVEDTDSGDIILRSNIDKLARKFIGESYDPALCSRVGKSLQKDTSRIYKELSNAIAKAYMSMYSLKESPQQFLSGEVKEYSPIMDCSDYQKYLHFREVRANSLEGFRAGVEDKRVSDR